MLIRESIFSSFIFFYVLRARKLEWSKSCQTPVSASASASAYLALGHRYIAQGEAISPPISIIPARGHLGQYFLFPIMAIQVIFFYYLFCVQLYLSPYRVIRGRNITTYQLCNQIVPIWSHSGQHYLAILQLCDQFFGHSGHYYHSTFQFFA